MFNYITIKNFNANLYSFVSWNCFFLNKMRHSNDMDNSRASYLLNANVIYFSLVVTKQIIGICDQMRPNPVCLATETSYNIELLRVVNLAIII